VRIIFISFISIDTVEARSARPEFRQRSERSLVVSRWIFREARVVLEDETG